MGDKKSCRATVFGRKIFVIKPERNPRLLVHEVFQRQICGVVTVRMYESVVSIRFYVCKYGVEGNAFPVGAEFRPSRNTVQINREGVGRQVAKRPPVPSPQNIIPLGDRKLPLVKRHVGRWSGG